MRNAIAPFHHFGDHHAAKGEVHIAGDSFEVAEGPDELIPVRFREPDPAVLETVDHQFAYQLADDPPAAEWREIDTLQLLRILDEEDRGRFEAQVSEQLVDLVLVEPIAARL